MKILISGLTAAGKTTHTRLLSEAYNIPSVHFTPILLEELSLQARNPDHVWFDRMREIDSMREGGEADRRTDERILAILRSDAPVIVDAALSPWMFRGSAIRIWIGSDRASRAWKCRVSRRPGRISTDAALRLLDDKDSLTRAYLLQSMGIDLYVDRSIFDIVIDNSSSIAAPSTAAATRGIAQVHRLLIACIDTISHGDTAKIHELSLSDPAVLRMVSHSTCPGIVGLRGAPPIATSI